MKMKVRDLLTSSGSLGVLGSLPLNTALKFRFARIIKQVQKALSDVNESKEELFNREGTFDSALNKYVWNSKEAEACVLSECKALENEEVDIVFDKFEESTFEKLEISSIDIANLSWMIRDFDIPKENAD